MARSGSDKKNLRRRDPRTVATHIEVHGIATRQETQEQVPFIIWDISDRGLRLWLPDHVEVGEVLRLTIAKPFVLMMAVEVRWSKALNDGSGFHVGVNALDNLQRLEALHRRLAQADKPQVPGEDD